MSVRPLISVCTERTSDSHHVEVIWKPGDPHHATGVDGDTLWCSHRCKHSSHGDPRWTSCCLTPGPVLSPLYLFSSTQVPRPKPWQWAQTPLTPALLPSLGHQCLQILLPYRPQPILSNPRTTALVHPSFLTWITAPNSQLPTRPLESFLKHKQHNITQHKTFSASPPST